MAKLSRRKLLTGSLALPFIQPKTLALSPKPAKLGVALVGLGYYSRDLLAPALQLTQYCELRGIVTGTPSKIPAWQQKYGIADRNVYNYQNMVEVANNPEIDIIYIVLPTFMHAEYSILAANAGKHVWCEKPMAMTVKECQAIMDACHKNKVQLTVGYRVHHEPNTQTVMQFAQSKPYGTIQNLVAKAGYAGGAGPQTDWRMNQAQGGGALYDMGVYPINAAHYATGMLPVAVSASYHTRRKDLFINADETTHLTIEFGNGVTANCATSVGENYNRLHVQCKKGWYELAPMQAYNGVKGKTSDGTLLNKAIANQQAAQMDNDALAIMQKRAPRVPGQIGLNDIRVVEGAIKSAQNDGKRVVL